MNQRTVFVAATDDAQTHSLVLQLLVAGHRAILLGNGPSAADRYRQLVEDEGLPDLLLVFLSLPDLDGVDFLQQLASEGLLCTLAVLSKDLTADEVAAVLRTPRVGVLDANEPAPRLVEQVLRFCGIDLDVPLAAVAAA